MRIADDEQYAQSWGEPVDPTRHRPANGATSTALEISCDERGSSHAWAVIDV